MELDIFNRYVITHHGLPSWWAVGKLLTEKSSEVLRINRYLNRRNSRDGMQKTINILSPNSFMDEFVSFLPLDFSMFLLRDCHRKHIRDKNVSWWSSCVTKKRRTLESPEMQLSGWKIRSLAETFCSPVRLSRRPIRLNPVRIYQFGGLDDLHRWRIQSHNHIC